MVNVFIMRRLLLLMAVLTVSGSLFAQSPYRRDYREDRLQPLYEPDVQNYYGYDYFRPFDDVVGYSIYGSQYRKARSSKGWGVFLCTVVAPISALVALQGISDDVPGWTAVGIAGLGGSLGCGIPLWRRGRRELDRMMDDYVRRYAPKPYSSNLSVGTTNNGVGLALNF